MSVTQKLADRLGMPQPTARRWVEGETPPENVQRMITRIGACPCILEERTVCGPTCWHFGNHKSVCRFCGQGGTNLNARGRRKADV